MSDDREHHDTAMKLLDEYGIFELTGQFGMTANEAAANFYRAFGTEVVLTPDNVLLFVEDAPAVEFPDGRALDQYGIWME